jgi:hypothetical protein
LRSVLLPQTGQNGGDALLEGAVDPGAEAYR